MSERRALWALQAVVAGLPLFIGGRHPLGLVAAGAAVLALLAATLRARHADPERAGRTPGVPALAGFVALALLTTVPLPPALLEQLSPATARLYRDTLAGWPGGGGWSAWRSLTLDPWATWSESAKLGVAFGTYAVLVGWPWTERTQVVGRMLLTLVCTGAAYAALAIGFEATRSETVLGPLTDEPVMYYTGRAGGPFVNPNHLAAWLGMVIPLGVAFAAAQITALRRRIVGAADTGHRLGVAGGRAWVTALVANQARLVAPLLALAAVALMVVGHLATQSRGGMAALLVGLGVTAVGLLGRGRRARAQRVAAAALGLALAAGGVAAVALWASRDADLVADAEGVDASFQQRLAVNALAPELIADFPLLGTGLGTFLHAFRPYVRPPVSAGIWDHAHNDYVELVTDTGAAGAALALAFALAAAAFVVRGRQPPASDERALAHRASRGDDDEFEKPAWRVALESRGPIAWGLAGGVAAILVHSVVEFGLRMPGNQVLLMTVVGCLVLSVAPRAGARSLGLTALTALLLVAAVPLVANRVIVLSGGMPLSPDQALTKADLTLAEGEGTPEEATALVRHAVDRSPAYREAHEQLAGLLDGAEAEAALRVALRIEPWSSLTRDALAMNLWQRGQREAAVAELEESIAREPELERHAFLSPNLAPEAPGHDQILRALAEGDTLTVRLATLDPALLGAVERGLARATAELPAGPQRAAAVANRVTLLEARERWAEAAELQRAEAMADPGDLAGLPRAAKNFLRAGDTARAEEALLAALLRTPERGDLYKRLAVDVYAARGDYATAEKVLAGGERNAIDRMPVYDAVTRVIAGRETAWAESLLAPGPAGAAEAKK